MISHVGSQLNLVLHSSDELINSHNKFFTMMSL